MNNQKGGCNRDVGHLLILLIQLHKLVPNKPYELRLCLDGTPARQQGEELVWFNLCLVHLKEGPTLHDEHALGAFLDDESRPTTEHYFGPIFRKVISNEKSSESRACCC